MKAPLISICLLIGITFISVPSQTLAQNTDHDTLIIGIEELEFIDPRPDYNKDFGVSNEVVGVSCQYMAALGMLAPGDSTDVLFGVAESWIHNENFTEWTYTLREGLTFHNGAPVDAKAIEYSMYANNLVYQYNPFNGAGVVNFSYVIRDWQSKGIYFSFPEADPTGSGRIITFHFSVPQLYQEWFFGSHWMRGLLVPYGSHGEYNDSAETCKSKAEDFFEEPVSAGPYKYKEWTDDYFLLEQSEDWFGWGKTFTSVHGKQYIFPTKEQAFKKIKFKMYPSSADFKAELLSGNIDVIYSEYYTNIDNATFESFAAIDQTSGFSVHTKPKVIRTEFGMNIQGNWPTMFGGAGNFPLSESWFRQAISHAIDREKIIDEAYAGFGFVSDSFFHPNILAHFPDIDTTDYYDFNQGLAMAESILDSQGYTALGFSEEDSNRFGYGLYLNETKKDGVEMSRGHHFRMISTQCTSCDKRSQSIVDDLKKVGIFVDLEHYPLPEFLEYLVGEPGRLYNSSYPEGTRDPKYNGSTVDFMVYGYIPTFGFPHSFVGGESTGYTNAWWYLGGDLPNSWFNNEYEVLIAKMRGSYGFLNLLPYRELPPDVPFPFPELRNNDTQYTEACEDAGELLSRELPYIPLVWYPTITAINDYVNDFLVDGYDAVFYGAYAYWDPGEESTMTTSSSTKPTTSKPTTSKPNPIPDYFLLFNACLILLVYKAKRKRQN